MSFAHILDRRLCVDVSLMQTGKKYTIEMPDVGMHLDTDVIHIKSFWRVHTPFQTEPMA